MITVAFFSIFGVAGLFACYLQWLTHCDKWQRMVEDNRLLNYRLGVAKDLLNRSLESRRYWIHTADDKMNTASKQYEEIVKLKSDLFKLKKRKRK